MANIREQIGNIMYALKSMVESGIFPDFVDLRSGQDHQGYNLFFIEFHL